MPGHGRTRLRLGNQQNAQGIKKAPFQGLLYTS